MTIYISKIKKLFLDSLTNALEAPISKIVIFVLWKKFLVLLSSYSLSFSFPNLFFGNFNRLTVIMGMII